MELKKIIDVGEFQGLIDWEKVKPHIDGAILRCGYGMDQADQDDTKFKYNADECTRLGIPFGVYIYSYADSEKRIRSEAAHVLRLVKGYKLSYPIYLDLEERGTETGAVDRARIFGDIIEQAGYWCGIYANLSWWNNYLKGLDRFTKWVAQWGVTKCQYKGSDLDMWQYSEKGRIPGINATVDMNYCYRDFPTEILGEAPKPTPEPEKPAEEAKGFALELDILRRGDEGRQVRALQILLNGNGFPCGSWGADGNFGRATEAALISFQKSNKLQTDGVAGPETWRSLLGV